MQEKIQDAKLTIYIWLRNKETNVLIVKFASVMNNCVLQQI